MTYVSSIERFAIERGMKKGMQQGIEKGIEKGIQQGIQQGLAQGLRRQLSRRFGPLSPEVIRQLERATPEQLETWTDRVLDARTLDEVFIEL